MENPVCDMCNQAMQWGDGAGLTTTQVTTTEAYWKFMLTHQWASAHQQDATGGILAHLIENQASQATTWLICNSCAKTLGYEPELYRRFNREGSNPPGTGPVAENKAALAAMFAWTELYGNWPIGIRIRADPPPHNTKICDFCRRRMYPDEVITMMKPDAVEAFERVGVLRRRGGPINMLGGSPMALWVACPLCMGRASEKLESKR